MPDLSPVSVVLLDIEGTTTPIEFVTRTLFPYARAGLAAYLDAEWPTADLQADLTLLEAEAAREQDPGPPWEHATRRQAAQEYLLRLMEEDRKSPALKSIQGKIWRFGYETGRLIGQVYPDVPLFLEAWRARGGRTVIYSSGSVLAQRLLFRYSDHGDLTPLLDGHFDTAIGSKREAASYAAIASALGVAPQAVCFVSDVTAELAAAREAGMQVLLSLRPGNPPTDPEDYPTVTDFRDPARTQLRTS